MALGIVTGEFQVHVGTEAPLAQLLAAVACSELEPTEERIRIVYDVLDLVMGLVTQTEGCEAPLMAYYAPWIVQMLGELKRRSERQHVTKFEADLYKKMREKLSELVEKHGILAARGLYLAVARVHPRFCRLEFRRNRMTKSEWTIFVREVDKRLLEDFKCVADARCTDRLVLQDYPGARWSFQHREKWNAEESFHLKFLNQVIVNNYVCRFLFPMAPAWVNLDLLLTDALRAAEKAADDAERAQTLDALDASWWLVYFDGDDGPWREPLRGFIASMPAVPATSTGLESFFSKVCCASAKTHTKSHS